MRNEKKKKESRMKIQDSNYNKKNNFQTQNTLQKFKVKSDSEVVVEVLWSTHIVESNKKI